MKAFCLKHSVEYFLKTLDKKIFDKGNMEDIARSKRLDFFQELYIKYNADGLVLGHHADDVCETTLKRVLEGAHLTSLSGIKAISSNMGMIIYRPLVNSQKTHILKWLNENKISYFLDYTNDDESFLRARMRKTILPNLETEFKKNIRSSLLKISEESSELDAYLSKKIILCFR